MSLPPKAPDPMANGASDQQPQHEAATQELADVGTGFPASRSTSSTKRLIAPGFGAHKTASLVVWPGLTRCREFTRARALLVKD